MRTHRITSTILLAVLLPGCSSSTSPHVCSVAFGDGLCLDMTSAGGLAAHQALIVEEVDESLDRIRTLLGVTDLRIVVIDDPSRVIPETGFGGFNPSPGEVRLFGDSNRPQLEAVIRAELSPTLAHEAHHAMRRRAIGYGSTLFEAAISEGLADHFSIEVSPGYDPPWATALTQEELDTWTPEVLSRSSGAYNHSAWFFGTGPTIPRWTGYAVGFALVGTYLDAHSAQRASLLVAEPAGAFRPEPTPSSR